MLPVILLLAFVTIGITVFCVFLDGLSYRTDNHKSNIGIFVILIVSVLIGLTSSIILEDVEEKANSEIVTTIIPFEEIYKGNGNSYIIKKNGEEIYNITTSYVSKGDSNYLICTDYKNVDKATSLLSGISNIYYKIVVTDTNIPSANKPLK